MKAALCEPLFCDTFVLAPWHRNLDRRMACLYQHTSLGFERATVRAQNSVNHQQNVVNLVTGAQCSRKRGQPLKKNVEKNVRKFTGHLITQPLIIQLPEVSTGKSRSPTSNILLRSVETRNYATENCV